jgi:pyridoxal phosphate enzyme (YggS family)
MDDLKIRIDKVRDKIAVRARACGRETDSIKLLVVTKTHAPEKILRLAEHGISDIGENRVQELQQKFDIIGERFNIHMVGHLQSNKVRHVVPMVSTIQSVDSGRVAELIEKECAKINKLMDVLIQINTSSEDSKFGVEPQEARPLAEHVMAMKHLSLKGLMTIGKLGGDEAETRECFKCLCSTRENLRTGGLPEENLRELSMGMTDDFEIAIEEGATILRIGSAIMGSRN